MKILVLNYEYPPLGGGGGVETKNLAEEWAKNRQKVDVLTSRVSGLPKITQQGSLRIIRVLALSRKNAIPANFLSMLSYLFFGFCKGVQLCISNKYDVINTHFAIPTGILGIVLAKLFKARQVINIHGSDIYNPTSRFSPHRSKILGIIVKWVLNNSARIIAHSSDIKEKVIKYFQIKKQIVKIPIGFKPVVIPDINRLKLQLDERVFYLITVGRLVKRKNFDYLIKMLAELTDKNIHLLLIGNGPEKKPLELLADQLNVSSRVKFLGSVDEQRKFQYLTNADLFILSSWHEGYGIVFQEAMYSGLPIIATDHGGQRDFLQAGENALFIDPQLIESGVAAVKKIKSDRILINKISYANRCKIKSFYLEEIAQKYLAELQQ